MFQSQMPIEMAHKQSSIERTWKALKRARRTRSQRDISGAGWEILTRSAGRLQSRTRIRKLCRVRARQVHVRGAHGTELFVF